MRPLGLICAPMKIPKKFFPVVFAFFLTLVMVMIVSGITTALNVGFTHDFFARWLKAWFLTWCVAFPSAIVVAPWARRLTEKITG